MRRNLTVSWWPGVVAAALLAGCAGGATRLGLPVAPEPAAGEEGPAE